MSYRACEKMRRVVTLSHFPTESGAKAANGSPSPCRSACWA
jgi:hypothetical protein